MEKVCHKCEETKNISEFRLRTRNGRKYRHSVCKLCDNKRIVKLRSTSKSSFCSARITQIRSRCRHGNISFDLTSGWMLEQLNNQEWKCALTGIPMVIHCGNDVDKSHWNTVSVDRIDPNAGYIKENVRFVIHQVNVFKGCNTDEQMYVVAKALINNRH